MFIEEKLKMLDTMDKKLEEDLLNFEFKKPSKNPMKKDLKGITVTKAMILQKSMCDELDEVDGLYLRD